MNGVRHLRLSACIALLAGLAACVPRAAPPPPQPTPPPRPAPAPPLPPASPPPTGWQDGPLASGDWSYSGGALPQATFTGPAGVLFAMRCDPGRQIALLRPGASGGTITISTTFGQSSASTGNDGQAQPTLPASDALFDQIAFSRGRILIGGSAGGDLVLPSWPEPARLIEECRG